MVKVGEACEYLKLGDRVLACTSDTYRTFAKADYNLVAQMPDNMTFTQGASLPTAFLTACYSLREAARLQKGESILIHAASGGTGQAAVQVALDAGTEVFVAAGSLSKKTLLMEVYGIPEDHIFYSRDTSFADGILRMTQGRGVNVVINSLSREGLIASWECITPFSRFLEIGKRDIDARGSLPMHPFSKNAAFFGVDLAQVPRKASLRGRLLKQVMSMVESGTAKPPQPNETYSFAEIEQALRFLTSGKFSGKLVLEIQKQALVPVSLHT